MSEKKSGLDKEKKDMQSIAGTGEWSPSPELAVKVAQLRADQREVIHRVAVAHLMGRGAISRLLKGADKICTAANYYKNPGAWLHGKFGPVLEEYIAELMPHHLKGVRKRVDQKIQLSLEGATDLIIEFVGSK